MAPNLSGAAGLLLSQAEVVEKQHEPKIQKKLPTGPHYEWKIVWRNVLAFVYLHTGALYGIFLMCTEAKWLTIVWGVFIAWFAGMGITAGAHRLWAHKSYKATWQLRLLLAMCQAMAFQNHIHEWVRDHRVHHKFTDTDADPHNSRRGFFFSHMGWLMVKKHKDVMIKGKTVDMSDLENDWVVVLQKKTYAFVMPFFCFFLPTWIPWYFWGEAGWTSWYVAGILRYTLSLNGTWLVNSAAHIYGVRPYDKTISPTENLSVAILAFGEGWHNYHHAFPWDYKTSEFSGYRTNVTLAFINFFAKIGWAYDLKTVPLDLVHKRAARIGDGSHMTVQGKQTNEITHKHEGEVWGWDDVDMDSEDKKMATIINRKDD